MIKFDYKTHKNSKMKDFTFSSFVGGNYIDCDRKNSIIKDFYDSNLTLYWASLTNLGIVKKWLHTFT